MMHSPEPWILADNHEDKTTIVDDAAQYVLPGLNKTDAERIIACVNACRGIPNEELEEIVRDSSLRSRFYSNNFPILEWVKRA